MGSVRPFFVGTGGSSGLFVDQVHQSFEPSGAEKGHVEHDQSGPGNGKKTETDHGQQESDGQQADEDRMHGCQPAIELSRSMDLLQALEFLVAAQA